MGGTSMQCFERAKGNNVARQEQDQLSGESFKAKPQSMAYSRTITSATVQLQRTSNAPVNEWEGPHRATLPGSMLSLRNPHSLALALPSSTLGAATTHLYLPPAFPFASPIDDQSPRTLPPLAWPKSSDA